MQIFKAKKETKARFIRVEKKVNFNGKEYTINTFPFLAQETNVICCAQADVLMVTLYLNKKFKYKKLKIEDTFIPERNPLEGFFSHEISKTFYKNNIKCRHITRNTYKGATKDDAAESIKEISLAYIKSNVPCIIDIDEHVAVAVGYTEDKKGNKELILYDDSAHFTKQYSKKKLKSFEKNPFVLNMSLKELFSFYQNCDDIGCYVPCGEKVFITYETIKDTAVGTVEDIYKKLILEKFSNYSDEVKQKAVKEKKEEAEKGEFFLIESYKALKVFCKNGTLRKDLPKEKLPSYFWCVIPKSSGTRKEALFFDSTVHEQSKKVLRWHSHFQFGVDELMPILSK